MSQEPLSHTRASTRAMEGFEAYYPLTEEDLANLWRDCTFTLDANVLLNLYRYPETPRNRLLGVPREMGDRLWVPHQAAQEYHYGRLGVLSELARKYGALRDYLRKTLQSLEGELIPLAKKHPHIPVNSILTKTREFFTTLGRQVDELTTRHPDLQSDDPIREAIAAVLAGKIGPPYEPRRLLEVYDEGKTRYALRVPPGYSDAADKKKAGREYGDLVMWLQVVDYAKRTRKPIILVTDDRKEDWWWRFEGRTVGPRPELIQEIRSRAGVAFYMYETGNFLRYAEEFFGQRDLEDTINQILEAKAWAAGGYGQERQPSFEYVPAQWSVLADEIDRLTCLYDIQERVRKELDTKMTAARATGLTT